jgi:hypothetical protein
VRFSFLPLSFNLRSSIFFWEGGVFWVSWGGVFLPGVLSFAPSFRWGRRASLVSRVESRGDER